MAISVPCPGYARNVTVQDELASEPIACPGCGRVLAAASLRTTDHVPGSGDTVAVHPTAPASDLPTVPGYRVLREIARGGMGRVLAAHDLTLDREVALKILLPGANADRFVRESKITARLPHPGIPPVHALGTLADGSPFLAMKLIAGQTLADEMKTAARPRLLQAFTQVCQAVGFAHSRGVIHRDLKPLNIMVGAFGEVQVMDWGLAKVLLLASVGRQPHESESSSSPDARLMGLTPHARQEETQTGAVLGTPAYMAPEQARGEVTDARSDVFALGGILCAILTGQPPFGGSSTAEVIRRAAAAELAEALARLDACGADAELLALCRRFLSPRPEDRPANGQAVADGMTAYLNGVQERLQAAERERAVAVAREAEQQKRRRVQLALAGAVVVLLLGGVAFAWWRHEQAQIVRQRDARNAEAVAVLLDQCAAALRAGDAAKAAVALEAARKRSTEGGAEEQSPRLGRLDADLALLLDLDAIDQFRWTPVGNNYPAWAVVATRYREALTRFGANPESLVPDAVARAAESTVRDRLVGAFDWLLWIDKTAAVRAVLRGLDTHRYRDAVRDALVENNATVLAELASRPEAADQPADFLVLFSSHPAIPTERRRELMTVAVHRRPGDLRLLMGMVSTYPVKSALAETNGAEDILRWSQVAVAVAPGNFAARLNLGNGYAGRGEWAAAEAEYREAVRLNPKSAMARNNLGAILNSRKDPVGSECELREALRLDPTLPLAHDNLGALLTDLGRLDEALACFLQALRLDPKNARYLTRLGAVLEARNRWVEAEARHREALLLDPKNASAHRGLGNILYQKELWTEAEAEYRESLRLEPRADLTYNRLGLVLAKQGDLDGAIAAYKESLRLNPSFAWTHDTLGVALKDTGDFDGAIAAYKEALKLDPKLALAHNNLGYALQAKGDLDGAFAAYKASLKHDPAFALAHNNVGYALQVRGDFDGAMNAFKEALRHDPKLALAHNNVGYVLQTRGDFAGAMNAYKEALKHDPKLALAHNNSGFILLRKGDLDGALAAFKEALKHDPKLALAHNNCGVILRERGDLDGAIAAFKEALKHDPKQTNATANLPTTERLRELLRRLPDILAGIAEPKSPDEACEFGRLCHKPFLTQYADAVRLYQRAFTADPKLADDLVKEHRYNAACYAARAARGDGKEAPADPAARAVLRAQALDWLRTDLALRAKQALSSVAAERKTATATLTHWLRDADLAGIRDAPALAKLPADEQKAFAELWTDVAAVLKQAAAPEQR